MNLNRLTETDLYGQYYLKVPGGDLYKDYYDSLETVRSLVTSPQWEKYVTGFFINVSEDGRYAVRLTYFTSSPDRAQQLASAFVREKGLQQTKNTIPPAPTKTLSATYGGEELQIRKFLATYTLIALDIMKADLLNARCLLATFRWQVMLAGKPPKPHFIKTFEQQSPFYNSLSPADNAQFWQDLSYWPNPRQVDWAHMFVNMVLAADWIQLDVNFFRTPKPPLSITQINNLIKQQGFQIPAIWVP